MRPLQVVRHLVAAGHDVHVVTAAPEFVFTTEISSPCLHIRKVLLDCGAVQADALTVDRLASLEKVRFRGLNNGHNPFPSHRDASCPSLRPQSSRALTSLLLRVIAFACGMQYHQTAVVPRESILKAEVEWLNSIKADLVVSYHDH